MGQPPPPQAPFTHPPQVQPGGAVGVGVGVLVGLGVGVLVGVSTGAVTVKVEVSKQS